jgi:hypothetical protein
MTIERALMGTADATATAANYIEDVFSTWLYTGNSATQTITNGIDLSTKGGMVWIKGRNGVSSDHLLFDTERGATKAAITNSQTGTFTNANSLTSFSNSGFSVGSYVYVNAFGMTPTFPDIFTSWTFREQAKFFDVVTYTGNGVAGRTIAHNLGSVPGMIIVQSTSSAQNWVVYHSSQGATKYLVLNGTGAALTNSSVWNNTAPTSSNFTVGTGFVVNESGSTYVAYLFAHDAGGFGASGTDNVISCGSYTGNGSASGPTVTLGYEPQYVMVKASSTTGNWVVEDVMRGMSQTASQYLLANTSAAEVALNPGIIPTATGFTLGTTSASLNSSGVTYIYLAIRRGPMRTPTDGTSVFSPIASSAAGGTKLTTNFPVDAQIFGLRTGTGNKGYTVDRLRGVSANATESGAQLITNSTAAETTTSLPTLFWDNTGFKMPSSYGGASDVFWNFGRAPGFFDVVCYTGTGVARTVNHNLGVAPEMMILKSRSAVGQWAVYSASLGNTKAIYLNGNGTPVTSSSFFNDTSPTSSVFTVNFATAVNDTSVTYVAYLFASCPGVSKVGSYTGNGSSQTINCGFTAGARFVLIKRTDSSGDWYTYDTARGMVSGTDPYLLMNSTVAEVNANYVFTSSTGFTIQAAAPAGINANGGTFIYLAIA